MVSSGVDAAFDELGDEGEHLVDELGADVRVVLDGARLAVSAARLGLDDVALGDSIAVNGVCLTVVSKSATAFEADVSAETFSCTVGLEATGDNLFLQTAASGGPVAGNPASAGVGSVMQGFIETSNVNVVTEITNLITAQRSYEMNSRVITASNDMLSTLTNLR